MNGSKTDIDFLQNTTLDFGIDFPLANRQRVINALRASKNAKNQWVKDYWYGVAIKIVKNKLDK